MYFKFTFKINLKLSIPYIIFHIFGFVIKFGSDQVLTFRIFATSSTKNFVVQRTGNGRRVEFQKIDTILQL